MQVLKQRVARRLLAPKHRTDSRQTFFWPDQKERRFWQLRFYDFNVWSDKKRIEKLNYMHRNPVSHFFVYPKNQTVYFSAGKGGPPAGVKTRRAKRSQVIEMAERGGFEPPVQVLARTTV